MRKLIRGGPAVLVLALSVALGLAGCGSSDDGGRVASADGTRSTGPSAAASLSRDEMGVKFAQCMREHGVDVPDPEPGKGPMVKVTGGTSQDTVNQAMEACRQYSPQGDAGGAGNAHADENNRNFAKCMRDNGVEAFPDPQPGQVGVRVDGRTAEDPDFQKAQQQCQSILAGGR